MSSKWAKGTGGPAGDECYNLVPAVYESHPNDSRVTGPVEQSPTVAAQWGTGGNNTPLVQDQTAFRKSRRAQSADDAETWVDDGKANTLNVFDTGDIRTTHAVTSPRMAVRRLTPVECERLQGFPDGWTDIMPKGKPTPDGPRYKALGNSMAVPVMRWIGQRIKAQSGTMT